MKNINELMVRTHMPESVKEARNGAEWYGGELYWQEIGFAALSDFVAWRCAVSKAFNGPWWGDLNGFDVLSAMNIFEAWVKDSGDSDWPFTQQENEEIRKENPTWPRHIEEATAEIEKELL